MSGGLQTERFDGGSASLVLAVPADAPPSVVYFGARLPDDATPLPFASERRESTPDIPAPPSLFPMPGLGWLGAPALEGHFDTHGLMARWSCEPRRDGPRIAFTLAPGDGALGGGLRVTLALRLDPETGALETETVVENQGPERFHLGALASVCLPLPAWAAEIVAFQGHWSAEGQPHRFAAPPGRWTQESRGGRTGFSGSSFLVCEPGADTARGRVIGAHLAWSGNHRLGVESLPCGDRVLSAGALLMPGEVTLETGQRWQSPKACIAFSQHGFDGVSAAFHAHARSTVLPPRRAGPRPVHFNTWEAVYFDFDETRLMALAELAAKLGAERFVLDDGWFQGRSDDTRALGDWSPDSQRFPTGLKPLIDHVRGLGMGFGLWVEPEMVSPDSSLYRTRPDWALHATGMERPTMRQQLALDLSRPEVIGHVFGV